MLTTTPITLLDTFSRDLALAGLNLFGVADVAGYDASVNAARRSDTLFPDARCIIVIGSGGPALWSAFTAALITEPRLLTEEPHPLDAYVRREVLRCDRLLGQLGRRWFFAAAAADIHLDFRLLGSLAGLGHRSRLGLLLNNRYGPWVGLRAACFLAQAVPATELSEADPCAGCPGYCAQSCPGQAFVQGHWEVDRCSAFHAKDNRCQASCDARAACPIGREHRYSAEEIQYHYNREQGRRALRTRLGITGDRYEGEGPFWGSWKSRISVSSKPGQNKDTP